MHARAVVIHEAWGTSCLSSSIALRGIKNVTVFRSASSASSRSWWQLIMEASPDRRMQLMHVTSGDGGRGRRSGRRRLYVTACLSHALFLPQAAICAAWNPVIGHLLCAGNSIMPSARSCCLRRSSVLDLMLNIIIVQIPTTDIFQRT